MSVRVATHTGGSATDITVFGNDMPRPVPLQRWDNDGRLVQHGARFSGFMEGAASEPYTATPEGLTTI